MGLEMGLVSGHHDVQKFQGEKQSHHQNHSPVFRLRGLWVDARISRQVSWTLGAPAGVVLNPLLNGPELLEAERLYTPGYR